MRPAVTTSLLALALGLAVACSGKADTADTAGIATTNPTPTNTYVPDPCDVVEIDYDGEDEPSVGDSWTLFMRCDGAVMMGATVIQFDPMSFATIAENVITFQEVGAGTLFMQTGSYQAELDITVQ